MLLQLSFYIVGLPEGKRAFSGRNAHCISQGGNLRRDCAAIIDDFCPVVREAAAIAANKMLCVDSPWAVQRDF